MLRSNISIERPRRLRRSEPLRALVRESHLRVDQLVMPLFVRAGQRLRVPIPSMPGQCQLSVDEAAAESQRLHELGIPAVLLFGLSDKKDARGSRAWAPDGLVQRAVEAIKAKAPRLLVISDVCLCAYTTHGHCGLLKRARGSRLKARGTSDRRLPGAWSLEPGADREVEVDNDATLELLAKTAVSHARAGADLVAPSDMMDGTVGAIRRALDEAGLSQVPILGYSVKFASALYAPFRQAVESAPQIGDRRSYQMDIANRDEALREVRLDLAQGADLVMVKPALAYLDVIRRIKETFHCPVAAFNVSGEYAMVKAAAARGWLEERAVVMELLTGLKRAGADVVITYWAKDVARWFQAR